MLCKQLADFYADKNNDNILREPECVSGMIFAISSSPDIPMPETWMPWTLSLQANHINAERADLLADVLMSQLRWQLDKMRKDEVLLPNDCKWHHDKALRSELEQWLNGFTLAHKQCEKAWQTAWQHTDIPEGSSRLTRILKCVTILADSDAALNASLPEKRPTLEENLPVLAKQLEQLLKDYVALAGELAPGLPGQFETDSSAR